MRRNTTVVEAARGGRQLTVSAALNDFINKLNVDAVKADGMRYT